MKKLILLLLLLNNLLFTFSQSLEEAQVNLNTLIANVSNPGKSYNQVLKYDLGKTGLTSITISSFDSKGKAADNYTVEFYLEHIDFEKFEQVNTSSELKVKVNSLKSQKLFKMVRNNRPSYVESFSIYCNDAQMARDVTDQFKNIIQESPMEKLLITSENEAYKWLTNKVKGSFTSGTNSYTYSLAIDTKSNNRFSFEYMVSSNGNKKQLKYDFYLLDFDLNSFKIFIYTGNILAINATTVNNVKVVTYYENGIKKSFVNKFVMPIDDAKLAQDIIMVFEKIKTNVYDKEEVINITNVNEDGYKSDENYTNSSVTVKFTKSNIKSYTDKTYVNNTESFKNELLLKADNTYLLYFSINGGDFQISSGSYSEKNGAILLNSTKCYSLEHTKQPTSKEMGEKVDCITEFGSSLKLELVKDERSLYYGEYLKLAADCSKLNHDHCLDGVYFGVTGSEPASGAAKYIGNIEVVTLGKTKGTLTANTKFKSLPHNSSKNQDCSDFTQLTTRKYSSISTNQEVQVIARTKDKFKVSKVEDYWYLIAIGPNSCEVWVHGQFLALK